MIKNIKEEVLKAIDKYNKRGNKIAAYIHNRAYFKFNPAIISDEFTSIEGEYILKVEIPVPQTPNNPLEITDTFSFKSSFSEDVIKVELNQLKETLQLYLQTLNVFLNQLRVKTINDTKYLIGRRCTKDCVSACIFGFNNQCALNNEDLQYISPQDKCLHMISSMEIFVREASMDESKDLLDLMRNHG